MSTKISTWVFYSVVSFYRVNGFSNLLLHIHQTTVISRPIEYCGRKKKLMKMSSHIEVQHNKKYCGFVKAFMSPGEEKKVKENFIFKIVKARDFNSVELFSTFSSLLCGGKIFSRKTTIRMNCILYIIFWRKSFITNQIKFHLLNQLSLNNYKQNLKKKILRRFWVKKDEKIVTIIDSLIIVLWTSCGNMHPFPYKNFPNLPNLSISWI